MVKKFIYTHRVTGCQHIVHAPSRAQSWIVFKARFTTAKRQSWIITTSKRSINAEWTMMEYTRAAQ